MKENTKNNQLRGIYDDVMLPNYSPAYFIPEKAEGSRIWDKDNKAVSYTHLTLPTILRV